MIYLHNVKRFYRFFNTTTYIFVLITVFLTASCATSKQAESKEISEELTELYEQESAAAYQTEFVPDSDTITLLFAGDIMAHDVNYSISDYPKIWRDVKAYIEPCDLAFANIEAPIDNTQKWHTYPNFNIPQAYVEAAVDAGFDVFSLCNNHTNDQGLNGIKETVKSAERLVTRSKERNENIYFSGLKDGKNAKYTYNLIEKNGWKILFLPMTEILNRPNYSEYINYVENNEKARKEFIKFVKTLRQENECDLMVLSVHAYEVEYTRNVTETQNQYYMDLLDAGVDILWANHAHIIKDRKIVVNTQTGREKLIMYANGNTISGQRTKPELTSKNPTGERDNTGDGLLYKVTFHKEKDGSITIKKCEPQFITTYINTASEYVLKPLNQDFVDYLYDVPRANWAKYIERRIKINKEATKDLIEWQ